MYDSNNFGVSDDFEYHEIIIDSRDALSQYSPNYTSLNWPKIFLGKELERVAAVKVLQVVIPKTWYNVTSDNGTFRQFMYFTQPPSRWTMYNPAVITPGRYTKSLLLTATVTAMVAAPINVISITDLPSQMKSSWAISGSGSSVRTFMHTFGGSLQPTTAIDQAYSMYNNNARNNPRRALGWQGGSGAPTAGTTLLSALSQGVGSTGATITAYPGPNVPPITQLPKTYSTPNVNELDPPSLYLNSKTLGSMINNIHLNGAGHMVTPGTGADEEQICSIPIPSTTLAGENIIYSDPDPQKWFRFGGNLNFPTSFDFYLTSGVNIEPLDLNGSSFVIKLGVLTNKREFERTFPTSTSGGYERVRNLVITK